MKQYNGFKLQLGLLNPVTNCIDYWNDVVRASFLGPFGPENLAVSVKTTPSLVVLGYLLKTAFNRLLPYYSETHCFRFTALLTLNVVLRFHRYVE